MPEQPDRNRGPSAAELMQARVAEEAARKDALRVVERWNAERSLLWSPTIRCAVIAGTPWLDVYCPGCRTKAGRLISARSTGTRKHQSAALCSACGVPSVLVRRLCRCSPGYTPYRRPRGGAKVCQWNSCTAVRSAPEDLELIRREIEAFDDIGAVDDEIRGIVARNWPDLLSKLPPKED
jgi:hypothetical protein